MHTVEEIRREYKDGSNDRSGHFSFGNHIFSAGQYTNMDAANISGRTGR